MVTSPSQKKTAFFNSRFDYILSPSAVGTSKECVFSFASEPSPRFALKKAAYTELLAIIRVFVHSSVSPHSAATSPRFSRIRDKVNTPTVDAEFNLRLTSSY